VAVLVESPPAVPVLVPQVVVSVVTSVAALVVVATVVTRVLTVVAQPRDKSIWTKKSWARRCRDEYSGANIALMQGRKKSNCHMTR
jgi:uncharacterized protein HemY